jgi:orotate phosphoribosyltransferase
MKHYNSSTFECKIFEYNVIRLHQKPITLPSGRETFWSIDWSRALGDTLSAQTIAGYVSLFARSREFPKKSDKNSEKQMLVPDCFVGIPNRTITLGTLIQENWAMSREDYRKGRYPLPLMLKDGEEFKYYTPPRGNVILVKGLTSTGESIEKAIEATNKIEGVRVIGAISLIGRIRARRDGKSVRDVLQRKYGVPHFSMVRAEDIISKIVKMNQMPRPIQAKIKQEFEECGFDTQLLAA